MITLEITIQRNKEKSWPVILTRTRTRDFLPVRTDGTFSLDIETFLQDAFSPEYGQMLGQAFFQGKIKDAFISALTSARAASESLRLLLFIEAEDLRELRWERLTAPIDDGWVSLAGNQQVLFSQYLPSTTDRRFPPIGRRDLRALVLVAAPSDLAGSYKLAEFDVAATVKSVKESLGEIPSTVLANTEGPENAPTLDNLCRCITAERYSLLHIVCHGSYRSSDGETILFFPNETGRPVPTTLLIERLEQLSGAKGLPHLAFLSTCESADPRAENGLGGLGHRLVRQLGMPVVVAMTDKVSIPTAQALASAFYKQLREHGEADRALSEATAGLLGRFDLTVPALFTRIGGKPIFNDSLDRPLTSKEIAFGLETLATLLETRAPVLVKEFEGHARKIRSTLDADFDAISPQLQNERRLAMEDINQICVEVVEISFNALALGQQPPTYDSRPPFRGLFPFRNDDKEFFFGREVLVEKLVGKVKEHNFLAVLGPSGSGKSSLVLAGLIPALGQSSCYMTPNSDPLAQLDVAMRNARPRSVLVVDQFEEIFTLCSDHYRREAFIQKLLEMSKKQQVIVTMRADFWGEVAPYADLRETMQNHIELVAPMNPTELRRAMDMQAAHVGLRFEADLSQDILDDVQDEPGAMPLLQHALLLLWNRRHGRWMRSEEYRQMGGIREAIARTADEVYINLDERNRERMRDIFVRLTRLDTSGEAGSEGRDTRRRVGMSELVPAGSDPTETAKLVKQLADARIIVTSVNAATRQEEAEVAHEALIRHWPRLRTWLDEDRVSLRLREGIREAALEWDAGKRDTALLVHRGGRLEDAEVLSRQPRFSLNMLEQAYLKACIDHREYERLAAERRRRQIVVASLIAGLLMMLLGCYGLVQANYATRNASTATYALGFAQLQAQTAEAARLTSDANARAAHDQAATATYALGMAQQQAATALAAQNEALRQAGIATNALGVSDQQRSTAQSAQGTSVVNANSAQTQAANAQTQAARATQAQGQAVVQASTAQAAKSTANAGATVSAANAATAISAQATALASDQLAKARAIAAEALLKINDPGSPELAFLLAAESFRRLDIYDSRNAMLTTILSMPSPALDGFLSRPDSTTISAGQPAASLISFRAAANPAVYSKSPITSVAINPTGTMVAAGRADGKIMLWNVARREPLAVIDAYTGGVTALAFSPVPGSKILASSGDGYVKTWDVATFGQVATLNNFNYSGGVEINSLVFTPDGQKILFNFLPAGMTYFPDGGFLVADAATLQVINWVGKDTPGKIAFLALSPDGQTLAAVSIFSKLILWDTTTWTKTAEYDIPEIKKIAFSPDGQTLVTGINFLDASFQPQTKIAALDTSTFTTRWEWTSENSQYSTAETIDLQISPDGKTLATAGQFEYASDLTKVSKIDLWNLTDGQRVSEFIGHTEPVRGIVFTPDGKRLLSGSEDTTLRIWEISAAPKLDQQFAQTTYLNDLDFSPSAPAILASFKTNGGNVEIMDMPGLQELTAFGQPGDLNGIALNFGPANQLATGIDGIEGQLSVGGIHLWNADSGIQTGTIVFPNQPTRWGSSNSPISLAFSPDGQWIATGANSGNIYIHSTSDHSLVLSQKFADPAGVVTFSPDSQTLAANICESMDFNYACLKWEIHFWKLEGNTWQQLGQTLPGASWGGLAYSPDGKLLAVARSNGTIVLWNTNDLSQNGTALATTGGRIVFSSDGMMLLASNSSSTTLWDVQTHNPIGLSIPINGRDFNADGTFLAGMTYSIGQEVTTIHLFDLKPQSWFSAACHLASRNFTRAEWDYYFPGEAYQMTCAQWPAGK
jgi:WD40 repeat protein/energy-coupling factor transporter ATP-binding protein EcfA2